MWSSSCRVTDAKGTDTRFVTTCDVYPGQSGSPVWFKPIDDSFELRAILTYESCRCCTADGSEGACGCCTGRYNGANAINAMHYASIQAWK
jgi:V8-like Glu-specific endopeptidase